MSIEENDMINMRAKMSGFIFPNVPISDFERAAFERAVNYQIEHERQRRAAVGMSLPEGVTSVAIGHFSASFDDSAFTGKDDLRCGIQRAVAGWAALSWA